MTRKRGTCVLVGLPPGDFAVPIFDVVANYITIRGSFVGTRQDMVEALAFAADGRVKADIELQPLSAINQVLDRLEHGDVVSRVVLESWSRRQHLQRAGAMGQRNDSLTTTMVTGNISRADMEPDDALVLRMSVAHSAP